MNYKMTPAQVQSAIREKLSHIYGVSAKNASDDEFYKASALVVRDLLVRGRDEFVHEAEKQETKQIYYLCMEFLLGRSLKNNLFNLGLEDSFRKALSEMGVKLDNLYEQEPDAGLGNGGLGRLAACFLDGLATQGYPAMGYSLRYEYGIFRQKLVEGWQTELPDFWLPGGEVWMQKVDESAIEVHFDGYIEEQWHDHYHSVRHKNYNPVMAIPYDLYVSGMDGKGISVLRIWRAEANEFDMKLFNSGNYMRAMEQKAMAETITKVLYPEDNHYEGKSLRLAQQYFLVSASVQDIVRRHLYTHSSLDDLPKLAAIHLNDTHPVLAIPELMRIMLDECGYEWDAAWDIVTRTIAYTNHTVMQEALEKWDLALLASVCPELVAIIRKIDAKFKADMAARGAEVKATRCIIWNNQVHMAQLAVYATVATNGVAAIHTEILKDDVFADWYALYPERFQNKTNGITQRRWLGLCNPELTALIEKHIGSGFLTDLDKLEALKPQISDDLCREFIAVKKEKKAQLAAEIEKREGVKLDPNMIFDIQVKRLHEYKRQLMNTMSILHLYFCLKDGTLTDFTPTAFIFGAKAAPGYARAKAIIHLTNMVADMVNNDPDTSSLLKVVFVHNYNCSWAEKLIPAADVSEQISTAGTEASGTGNMKLMLNGAVTLGTYDGANVEITEQAGRENEYIFGATVEEINALKKNGYDPRAIYKADKEIARVLDTMVDGTFPDPDGSIKELVSSLLLGASWHKPDHYFILHDFHSYVDAKLAVNRDYRDELSFARKCLMNIASAGMFSSDRTIAQYAKEIWKV